MTARQVGDDRTMSTPAIKEMAAVLAGGDVAFGEERWAKSYARLSDRLAEVIEQNERLKLALLNCADNRFQN